MPWYKRMNWERVIVYTLLCVLTSVALDPNGFLRTFLLFFVCSLASHSLTGKQYFLEPKRKAPREPQYDPYDKRVW